ncbi:MAG: radical SAM protein [Desulfobacteraceae bacterium]|nr:radical SAM protein [Desulfobacteraceae bacterium]
MKACPVLDGSSTDIVLYLHLTRDCNLRCNYCYGGIKTREAMPFDVARRAIDMFLDRTEHLGVRFFGGEPLLRFSSIREITAYCEEQAAKRNKRIDFAAVTNGTLLTEEVARFFAGHSIEYSVSFDGHRAAQDTNRLLPSGEGSFRMLERNLEHMLRLNPYANVVRVVSPNNLGMLVDSVKFYLDRGFSIISFSPDYTHPDFGASVPDLKRRYLEIADIYLQSLKRGKKIYFNIFDHLETLFRRGRCRFGRQDFSVDVSGDIYPCCCFADHKVYRLGDVESGIDPALSDAFLRDAALLRKHMEEDHKDCPDTSFCKVGCGCTNMVTTRKLSVIDPVICYYGRMEREVRDYVSAGLNR